MEVLIIMLFLSVPMFFVWRWLIGRWIKRPVPKNIAAVIVTAFAAPVVYVILIISLLSIILYYPKTEFNRKEWMRDKEIRYGMSKDIIDSKMLIGKSKKEVRQVLGNEGSWSYTGNTDDVDYWRYYLGFRPSIGGLDPDVLDVYFKNGKVVKVEQHES